MLSCGRPFGEANAPLTKTTFHGDRKRLGWNDREPDLTPARVASGSFGLAWTSPALDSVVIGGTTYAPRIYATPLFVENAPAPRCSLDLAYVATTNAFVYAIATKKSACASPGEIVWSTKLGTADVAAFDGGMPLGVLSTPHIELAAQRLYVTSMDATAGWQAFALDLASGRIIDGWPVTIGPSTVEPLTKNGPSVFNPEPRAVSQRSALNASPDGGLLYVAFGGYYDGAIGFMVAVDTKKAKVVSAFAGQPSTVNTASGGIWGPGGASVDDDGRVYATTGNSPIDTRTLPNVWGQSLLAWTPLLDLSGTYTPFNYCSMDRYDTDLGGSSPLLVPDSRLVAFGGKQGNIYLLDRDHLSLVLGIDRLPERRAISAKSP